MSRILSELLGYDPATFTRALAKIESTIDGYGVDVALIGNVAERSAAMHRLFRLDPRDTTPEEMYAVLRARVREDNERVARVMGGVYPNAVSEMTPLILKAIKDHTRDRTCWALKHSVAKKLLKKQPPKQLMKALNYRSLDSMLKHESIGELMTLARYIESPSWNDAMTRSYHTLTPADFESRPIEVIYYDRVAMIEPLIATHHRHKLVLHSKEMGLVAIAPTKELVINCYTLRTVSLLLHYISEITMMSSLLKYRHADKSYGQRVTEALINDTIGHTTLAGHSVHWRSLHTHVSKSAQATRPDMGAHMDDTDWLHDTANDGLARLVQAMVLWAHNGHVAKHDMGKDAVSFNVIDLAIDESLGASFAERTRRYMRRELENELFVRYLGHPTLCHLTLHRLNT